MSTKSRIRLIKKADRITRRKENRPQPPPPQTDVQQERATAAALINGWVDDLREKKAGINFKDQLDDQDQ